MRKDINVAAEVRTSRGKNEARRMRVAGKIPAVVYGAFQDPVSIAVDPRAIRHFLKTYHDERKRLAASAGNRLPVLQRRLGEVTRQAARLKAWSEAVLNAYLKAGGVWPPRPYEAPIKKYYRSKRIGES